MANINKLMQDRSAQFASHTRSIVGEFSDRLAEAFTKVFNATGRKVSFSAVEELSGSTKSLMVTGQISLEIGETIQYGDKTIVVDESNLNQYNKMAQFAFPIIMLELATADELAEHMHRVSKIGAAVNVSSDALAKLLDKIADEYETQILNDPSKVEVIEAATKPESVLGFSVTGLSDEQIRKLMVYEKMDLGSVN